MLRQGEWPDLRAPITERFGPETVNSVLDVLGGLQDAAPHSCGAAVFLACSPDELPELVALATTDPQTLLIRTRVKPF